MHCRDFCLGCKPDQELRGEAEAPELGRLLEAGDRAVCEADAEGVRRRRQDRVRGGHQVVFWNVLELVFTYLSFYVRYFNKRTRSK